MHGGIDAEGRVAPYASLILARAAGTLHLRGRRLPSAGLGRASCRVFADEHLLGSIALVESTPEIDESWPLPDELSSRAYVSLRFESDDFVYVDGASGDAACFVIESVRLD